jgi:hypothetical protein
VRELPEIVIVRLGDRAAPAVAEAAERLPPHEDHELRSETVQDILREALRSVGGDAVDALVEAIHERLDRPPHFAVVTGLCAARMDLLLVALSRFLGVCVEPYRESWSRLVRHIEARRERLIHRGRPLNEFLHTDGTDWPTPNDYTCLLCVRQDQRGAGESLLIDAGEMARELECRDGGASTVQVLRTEPLPWKIADSLGGGVVWEPALSERGLRWLRYTVDLALAEPDVSLEPRVIAALDATGAAIDVSERIYRVGLAPGDLLVVDNRRCLHGRTPIVHSESSHRLLLRTKVACDGAGA